ncbi:3-methyl-2-oxobutanoate hydroxymethyltransferase [uncultured Corynebacterium sp.]|uniref:3-methyl-2-oxobutanoate hydroxymethyltransferase n=1 Tax=uncultured Corynebacterium sp. TaxID=159447 RepID=UPI00260A8D8D|nr:3-methyl-2-oxobutanoate hydroxymethyltransferase [uncultured Corynebacterium sp.]
MSGKKIRLNNLAEWKAESRPWAMLTCYDYSTARAFSAAGVELLLVGDSAANVVYGYDTTTEITLEEMIPLARGVVRGAGNALVVADLPFGTYEASDEQAVLSAAKMMRETGAHMIKIEGGVRIAPRIRALVNAGIPVMAHIGFTPQSVNALSGFKVQGRGAGAEQLRADAHAVADAGAAAVVLEMVPADLATEITRELAIPTCGIGAGNQCDGQVLVWQDAFAVPADGRRPSFSSVFEEVGEMLTKGAKEYVDQVHSREFPTEAQNFSG